ncbi:MAG: Fic family protein [Anaerolineae bacterium]|nr:Fic family protein [Anaerolineae bacterium]
MYEPSFQRTDALIAMIGRIEAARAVVLRAPIAAQWESQLRHDALVRSAHHSTSIEGNPLSLEEVTDLIEGRGVTAHPREKREVLNYVEVLDYIDRQYQNRPDKSITEETILELHRLVVHDILPEHESGCYRRVPVVVAVPATGEVRFRPLSWNEVPALMTDFAAWLNGEAAGALMPVLHAGIAHYECVRIHPFVDGNGRTARALATLILYKRGFDTRRFFALEEYYNVDRQSYYEALAAADQSGDLTEWLEYFVQGIAVEMVRLEERITTLERIVGQAAVPQTVALDLHPRQIRALEFLSREPRLTTEIYRQWNRVARATAQRDLADLVARGLLRQRGVGRGTHYVLAGPDEAQPAPDEA